MVQDLNLRATTIKLLEENIRKIFLPGVSDDFLSITMKAQATKEKIDKLDFFKIKFCASKGHYRESGKTTIEKIFANHVSDKGLISRAYKELLNPTIKR